MTTWRKVGGGAYRLADHYSTLWARRSGGRWHLVYRDATAPAWVTLGTYRTLTEAKREGSALMT